MTEIEKSDLEAKIIHVIDGVRPYLLADGGDIQFVSITPELNVEVFLLGACSSCGMSYQTLASIESSLKNYLPQINSLIAVDYGLPDM